MLVPTGCFPLWKEGYSGRVLGRRGRRPLQEICFAEERIWRKGFGTLGATSPTGDLLRRRENMAEGFWTSNAYPYILSLMTLLGLFLFLDLAFLADDLDVVVALAKNDPALEVAAAPQTAKARAEGLVLQLPLGAAQRAATALPAVEIQLAAVDAFQIAEIVVLEGQALVEAVVAGVDVTFEKLRVVQCLEAQGGQLGVLIGAVETALLEGDPKLFGAGGQPHLAGAVVVTDGALAVLLEVRVVFQEGQLVISEEIAVVLHQHKQIAVAPAHEHAVAQKLAETAHNMGEGVVRLLELVDRDVGQRGDVGIQLLGDLGRDQLGEGVDDIQLFVQLHGADLDDLVHETVTVLRVGAVEFQVENDVSHGSWWLVVTSHWLPVFQEN